jgi:ankyrin repeat protein
MTLLHCAASNENVAVIKYIASKGQKSNVNAKDVEGSTPLHWAASNKNVEVAKYLVSLGADVKAKNKDGKTPFDIAKQKERYGFASPEVVKYLSNQ